jgi:hypothetical protein|tara:strand:- start:740 stop:919 length:180 start_codon:yes stop_codon:yes gene_type:complete
MYKPTLLNAPITNLIKLESAVDAEKSFRPKKKQGRVFTEFNNMFGMNSLKQGKKTLQGY